MSFRDATSPETALTDTLKRIGERLVNLERAGTDQVPPGGLMLWAAPIAVPPPLGWLRADGSAVSRTKYAALLATIGLVYGIGDGVSTFNVPNPAAYGGIPWIIHT